MITPQEQLRAMIITLEYHLKQLLATLANLKILETKLTQNQ